MDDRQYLSNDLHIDPLSLSFQLSHLICSKLLKIIIKTLNIPSEHHYELLSTYLKPQYFNNINSIDYSSISTSNSFSHK